MRSLQQVLLLGKKGGIVQNIILLTALVFFYSLICVLFTVHQNFSLFLYFEVFWELLKGKKISREQIESALTMFLLVWSKDIRLSQDTKSG